MTWRYHIDGARKTPVVSSGASRHCGVGLLCLGFFILTFNSRSPYCATTLTLRFMEAISVVLEFKLAIWSL